MATAIGPMRRQKVFSANEIGEENEKEENKDKRNVLFISHDTKQSKFDSDRLPITTLILLMPR